MSAPAAGRMLRAMPVLQVRDVKASEAFYCDALGFASHGTWGAPPVFAIVQRGHVTIALDQSRDGSAPPRQQYWSAYLYVADADAMLAEVQRSGVSVARDIETTDYGCRDFDIRDPDGHILGIGHVIAPGPMGPGLDAGSLGRDGEGGSGKRGGLA
ncbi:MAG: VOC family protein [Hyphomicrobiaceae bacterium]